VLARNLKLEDKKTLLVLPQSDRNVILSGRNIKNTRITTADTLNTYDVLHADTLVLVESSVEKIEQNLLKK